MTGASEGEAVCLPVLTLATVGGGQPHRLLFKGELGPPSPVASLGNRHILLDLRRLLIRHKIVVLLIVATIKLVVFLLGC